MGKMLKVETGSTIPTVLQRIDWIDLAQDIDQWRSLVNT
jgi:hypothetical protein